MLMGLKCFVDKLAFVLVVNKKIEIHTYIFSGLACVGMAKRMLTLQNHIFDRLLQGFAFGTDNFITPVCWINKLKFLINFVDIHHFFLLFLIRAEHWK